MSEVGEKGNQLFIEHLINITMNFDILKYSVGIDVSMKTLDVCFKTLHSNQQAKIKSTRKFNNTSKGIIALFEWIEKHCKQANVPCIVVFEATGVYHENAAYYLYNNGLKVTIILPNYAKSFMQSLGFKSKTDAIDAKGLAQMGIERNPRLWTPPSKQLMDLRTLSRYKDKLEKQKTACLNRLHAQEYCAQSNQFVIRQLKQELKLITKQIVKTKEAIEKVLRQESDLTEKINKMADSIKGIGSASIACIVAETNGFELFESQGQLISYAGYDVVQNQSGKRSGKTKISKKGNKHIRKTMHFPALNVVRWNNDIFVNLYDRVYDRTKIKMKGYVAVQRKLLCLIYTLWKKDEVFDPKHRNKHQLKNIDEILTEEYKSSFSVSSC